MKKFFYFARALLYPLAAILVPCKVMDKDKYKKYENGRLVVSNHLSWMDIPYQLFWLPGYKRVLSKKENNKNAFATWFLHAVGTICVDREKPELSAMRECIGELKNSGTIMVYPEGTRNRVDREIKEMHSGAAMFALKGDADVVPVVVHHRGKLCRRNYIGVGDAIDINEYRVKRLDEAMLNDVTERFRAAMQSTLDKLDAWVENKGWKKEKRDKKREKRRLKKQYKLSKKAAKKAAKAR